MAERVPKRRVWFWCLWLLLAFAMVGVSTTFYAASSRARLEQLAEDELHALGMRTDALAMVIQHTVADLQLISSQDAVLALVNGARTDSSDAERALRALAALHPEYQRVAGIPLDGRPAFGIAGAEGGQLARTEDPLADASGALDAQFARSLGGVFVALMPASIADSGAVSSRPDEGASLVVGVGLEDQSGELSMALAAQLPWADVLSQYALAHPGSVSLAYLQIAANGSVFFAGSASGGADRATDSPRGASAEAVPPIPGGLPATDGQFAMRGGLVSYASFYPLAAARAVLSLEASFDSSSSVSGPEPVWRAISWVPPSTLRGVRFAGLTGLVAWNLFGVLAMGITSWFAADRLARRNALHVRTAAERSLLSSALGRYVPKVRADHLLADPHQYATLGGSSRDVAVLFADVRGFTRFAERHDPPHVVATLNAVLASLVPVLTRHAGVLDKYLGDGFLAYFLPSADSADTAQRAVGAAHDMQEAFAGLYQSEAGRALAGLGLGIGISVGPVILGNVGSSDLMDFTVIGDTVNVAARLQASAAAGEILITDAAAAAIEPMRASRRRVEIELRGRDAAVSAWAIVQRGWIGPAGPRE